MQEDPLGEVGGGQEAPGSPARRPPSTCLPRGPSRAEDPAGRHLDRGSCVCFQMLFVLFLSSATLPASRTSGGSPHSPPPALLSASLSAGGLCPRGQALPLRTGRASGAYRAQRPRRPRMRGAGEITQLRPRGSQRDPEIRVLTGSPRVGETEAGRVCCPRVSRGALPTGTASGAEPPAT